MGVKITDSNQVGVDVVAAKPGPLSALVKYAQDPELDIILLPDFIKVLKQPLSDTAATPVSLGLTLGKSFDFGTGKPQLSIKAGASAAVHVNAQKGADLFSDNLYKSQITVQDAEGYLSLALTGSVPGKESQSKGDITFGFDAGATTTFEYFRSFPAGDLVCAALGEVISNFIIPADVTDLKQLKPGDIATCTGNRHIKVSADVSAKASAVPFASPNLPLVGQPVQLNASASIDLSASFELTSACQIRVRAVSDGVVELGVYKQHGHDWDIAVTASTGIDASIAGTDLLKTVIGKLSQDPKADQQQLQAAGLKPDEIGAINQAISSSIDHSLHASLSLDLNGLSSDQAAFLYRIELAKLNTDTAAAVTAALDGDLTQFDRLNPKAEENGMVGDGVTLVRSILTRTKKNGVTFKMNFLGLFNFLSLAEFVSKSEVIHEPTSGDVFFKETASGERIGVVTTPLAQTKLRKAIFDSILMTTAYQGGGIPGMDMQCSQVHFAMHSTTNEHTMSDYLDWFVALHALSLAEKGKLMNGFTGTGASTCTARVTYSDAACKAMFLGPQGSRKNDDYVKLGRSALIPLLLPGDQNDGDAFRRAILANDKVWNQFEGQTSIPLVMQKEFGWNLNDPRLSPLSTDYTIIVWWAGSMASTAQKVADMENFLQTADPKTLSSNKAFLSKAQDLQKHVMGLIKNSRMDYDQPFGLVALQWAAGGGAVAPATGILNSPAIHREFGAAAQQAGA